MHWPNSSKQSTAGLKLHTCLDMLIHGLLTVCCHTTAKAVGAYGSGDSSTLVGGGQQQLSGPAGR